MVIAPAIITGNTKDPDATVARRLGLEINVSRCPPTCRSGEPGDDSLDVAGVDCVVGARDVDRVGRAGDVCDGDLTGSYPAAAAAGVRQPRTAKPRG